MTNDEWITSALTDDTVVVELLFRLKQSFSSSSSHPPFPSKLHLHTPVLPPVRWGHRQQRSNVTTRKDSTRFSPTTPLSWSCGVSGGSTSPSDGGSDDSSRPSDLSSVARSKDPFTKKSNTVSATNTTISGKRKTFAELKEEETSLLKERIHLKKDLASVHVTLKEQRFKSENLKRIKFDLNIQSANKIGAVSDATFSKQCSEMEECYLDCAHSILPRHATPEDVTSDSCRIQKDIIKAKEISCFTLPDLNMPASEEEMSSETPNGMSIR